MNDKEFTALCQQQMDSLYRMSMAILRQHADAQDAVQQCLMKAWAARSMVRTGTEKAWLMRIVINESRNVQRRRMRMVPVEQLPENGYTPPDIGLREALDSLPENWRIPLLLRYMEGLSEKETARTLGITQTMLRGRLYRARRALEKALQEEVELE